MRAPAWGWARAASALLAAAALAAVLAGCQDLLNTLFDTGAPTGVSASDGDYPNEIHVSWSAPNLSGDKWKDYSVEGYDVSWSGPVSGSAWETGTSCSIYVPDGHRAEKYTVTVESRLLKGAAISSGGSGSDEGFALSTEPLLWYDQGWTYAGAGADRWYVTMLQKGFKYSFAFPAGEAGVVTFFKYKTLDALRSLDTPAEIQAWTCDQDGAGNKFYVRVQPGSSGSFVASYSSFP